LSYEKLKRLFFKRGKSVLTEAARRKLRNESHKIISELAKKSANQVNILGYASLDPRKKTVRGLPADDNLDLSAKRAVAVAHYLKSLGILYECMKVTGFGRGRSQLLSDWKQNGWNRTMDKWDKKWNSKRKSEKRNLRNSPEYKKERKVVLQVVYDKESKCTK
jgi:outer membrane protein OmpA-like peptidoglycan-associated protein